MFKPRCWFDQDFNPGSYENLQMRRVVSYTLQQRMRTMVCATFVDGAI